MEVLFVYIIYHFSLVFPDMFSKNARTNAKRHDHNGAATLNLGNYYNVHAW